MPAKAVPSETVVALAQMRCDEDRDANWSQAEALVAEAHKQGADVVCLPELFAGLYPCQQEDHDRFSDAEPVPGPTTERLGEWARRYGLVIIGSLFERRTAGLYHNTAVLIERDGRLVGHYRKMHIPDDPHYYEKFYFAPGDLGYPVFETSAGAIGLAVCWDQWFPEAARLLALAGAEIVFYPTAIGWLLEEREAWGADQVDAWRTSMRGHAIANGMFVAAVNRVGHEDAIEFWGHSFCCDPYGRVLIEAEATAEPRLVTATLDRSLVETARTHWPFLRDRRVDAYEGLLRRFLR